METCHHDRDLSLPRLPSGALVSTSACGRPCRNKYSGPRTVPSRLAGFMHVVSRLSRDLCGGMPVPIIHSTSRGITAMPNGQYLRWTSISSSVTGALRATSSFTQRPALAQACCWAGFNSEGSLVSFFLSEDTEDQEHISEGACGRIAATIAVDTTMTNSLMPSVLGIEGRDSNRIECFKCGACGRL